jgi:hypothetical protein
VLDWNPLLERRDDVIVTGQVQCLPAALLLGASALPLLCPSVPSLAPDGDQVSLATTRQTPGPGGCPLLCSQGPLGF